MGSSKLGLVLLYVGKYCRCRWIFVQLVLDRQSSYMSLWLDYSDRLQVLGLSIRPIVIRSRA